MPLPLPRLDRRSFAELSDEGRTLIPRYAPGWTDHNVHDPGITLLELFAWAVEAESYRLDRTSAAAYRAFLRLVGVEPRSWRPAETVLALGLSGAASPQPLPAGLHVEDMRGTMCFQTTAAIALSPASLVALAAGPPGSLVNRLPENTAASGYQPFGPQPVPGCALYLGFDRPLADAPVELNLYVWVGPPQADAELRDRLIAELQAAAAEQNCPPGLAPDLAGWRLHYSARTSWEYLTAAGDWRPLPDLTDETCGLTLSGFVRFTAPPDQGTGEPEPGRFALRCRLVAGGYECPPWISALALNAIPARHACDMPPEILGTSTGGAGQRVNLGHAPVVPGSTRMRVDPDGGHELDWAEVLFWDHSGPHDRHYLLDPTLGEISFGDGLVGRVPPTGATVSIDYQVGGGPDGNVPAGTLVRFAPGPHNAALVPDWATLSAALSVRQPVPAHGGAEAETLDEAQGRAVAAVAAAERAITLSDFEQLALTTPGVPVARARALADYHPDVPCFPAHGCVTVVVVPGCPDPRPTPGPDMLRTIARYLDRRRSLTTEVHVIGPRYTTVSVSARLHAAPEARAATLADRARAAIISFFHPLHGGPDEDGWPVGRDVYRAELQALLSALPGVVAVDQLSMRTEDDAESGCDNVSICPDSLLASGDHRIEVVERSTLL